jgi:hypothetical protein
MGKLLIDLQVRRSVADGPGARAFYEELTAPRPGWAEEIRDVVLKKKQVGRVVDAIDGIFFLFFDSDGLTRRSTF